jgi:membrane protease subunit HflK
MRSMDIGAQHTVVQATGLRDSPMLTEDENIVDMQFAVQYRAEGCARTSCSNNRSRRGGGAGGGDGGARDRRSKSKIDQVLYERARRQVAHGRCMTLDAGRSSTATGLGIAIGQRQPCRARSVPEQVQAAFDDAVQGRRRTASRLKNEGQAYASDVVPQGARHRRRVCCEEAEGYQLACDRAGRGRRRSASARLLAEYQKAPARDARPPVPRDHAAGLSATCSKVLVDQDSAAARACSTCRWTSSSAASAARGGAEPVAQPVRRTPCQPAPAPPPAADARARDGGAIARPRMAAEEEPPHMNRIGLIIAALPSASVLLALAIGLRRRPAPGSPSSTPLGEINEGRSPSPA